MEVGFGDTDCNDEVDNDGDGQMDFDDEDCADAFDTQEEAASTYCTDGSDNDGDGWTDVEDVDCMTGDEGERILHYCV